MDFHGDENSEKLVDYVHQLGKRASPICLDRIVARENKFVNELIELQAEGFPIYVMGSADGGGRQAVICLENAGIPYEGLLINRAFWTENSTEQCLENLMERTQTKVNIVIAGVS